MREKQRKAEEKKLKEEEDEDEEEKKEVKPKKKIDYFKIDNHTLGFSGGPGVLKEKKQAKKK